MRIAISADDQTIHGILKYKRKNGRTDWQFPLILERGNTLSHELVKTFGIDAAIGYLPARKISTTWLRTLPYVNLGADSIDHGFPSVINDDYAIGRLAAKHLIDLGLNVFHYVTITQINATLARFNGFKDVLNAHNHESSYQRIMPKNALTQVRGQAHDPKAFISFLATLTFPSAIFCMNDGCAFSLLTACVDFGIKVPEDVCVMGVNNDPVYSRLSTPLLTSVPPDLQRRGYEAAELLDRILHGEKVPPHAHLVQPKEIVHRGSTYRLRVDCEEVATALKFIAVHAGEHITVEDVASQIAFSRRSLELKFKEHLNRTIMEEIIQARTRIAKKLLRDTKMILTRVAYKSGFPNPARLQIAIKKDTGMTANEFRWYASS